MTNIITAIQNAVTALGLWEKYGSDVEKAMAIIKAVDAIDNGQIVGKIEAVLLSNGIDVATIIANLTGMANPVAALQTALNALGASPILVVDGIAGPDTLAAIDTWRAKSTK